jgi:segregation and condensation protein B
MYGTTRQFLDYFNLRGLDDLPTLMELRDIETINAELELSLPDESHTGAGDEEEHTDDGGDVSSAGAVQVQVEVPDNNETLH